MTATPEEYLRRRGVAPMEWSGVLHAIEARLAPPDLEVFRRRHASFTAYPMEHTCRAFYDFAGEHGLQNLLAGFRFERLCRIAACLSPLPLRGRGVLELGAGGGFLSGYLRDELGANVSVTDWSPKSLRKLQDEGFRIFSGSADPELKRNRFDFILCADSLGEVNADEDDWLRDPENVADARYADEMEHRYGFSGKLAPWRLMLRPGGSVLLFEPAVLSAFWQGVAASLAQSGWNARILGPEPVWGVVAVVEN